MDQHRTHLLARLASYCPTYRLILAKIHRRLPVDNTNKQHLIEEMHFADGPDQILTVNSTRSVKQWRGHVKQ